MWTKISDNHWKFTLKETTFNYIISKEENIKYGHYIYLGEVSGKLYEVYGISYEYCMSHIIKQIANDAKVIADLLSEIVLIRKPDVETK